MAQSFNLIPGQKLCWNCRKKLTNIEEENFDEEQDIKFEDIKENLNSSVEMLRCLSVKSVGSRDKIGYEKRKLTNICDAAKGETWKSVACGQQIFLNCHTYVRIFF